MDLSALIEKLSAATEGSRELDNEIFLATHPHQGTHGNGEEWWYATQLDEDGGPWDVLPFYSTSLDAALSLVPKGWLWGVSHGGHPDLGDYAWVCHPDDLNHDEAFQGYCPGQFALSLVIAALRAREAAHV